jgi:hypothetical protein
MTHFPVVDWLAPDATYILTNAITAFSTSRDEPDTDRCGPICELPTGAELMVCGGGFSKRTVRVRYGDCECYVFWGDLASAKSGDAAISGGQIGLLRLSKMLEKEAQPMIVEKSGQTNKNDE